MDRLLSYIHSLNSSVSKNVLIGLEYDNIVQNFIPKLRLIGNDPIGVPFDQETWNDFKEHFDEITLFFSSYNQNNLGRKINFGKHALNLVTVHTDKVIEISEVDDEVDGPMDKKRKWRRVIVYKFVTFNNLKKITPSSTTSLNF